MMKKGWFFDPAVILRQPFFLPGFPAKEWDNTFRQKGFHRWKDKTEWCSAEQALMRKNII